MNRFFLEFSSTMLGITGLQEYKTAVRFFAYVEELSTADSIQQGSSALL